MSSNNRFWQLASSSEQYELFDNESADNICVEAQNQYECAAMLNDGNDGLIESIPSQSNSRQQSIAPERTDHMALLNDGNDDLFRSIPSQSNPSQQSILPEQFNHMALLNDGNDEYFNNVEWPNNHRSQSVDDKINSVLRCCITAKMYLVDSFYEFEHWPAYMKSLFVINNIQNYSYVMRNKICLFFWGNGATYEVMCNLCIFFSTKPTLKTERDRKKNECSHRKCRDLFRTYEQQKFNPAYSEKYYFYSMNECRMLYIDGTPRHFGQRATGVRNFVPRWY